jgi:SAM-dependent MidA family methyltransferase
MSLRDRLIAGIAAQGPMTVADYMDACLHDPQDGYYATRPALGEAGDFITAPHVSQMFGELIGLWAVETWTRMGRPARFRLVELGPGDGTLMSDMLRASHVAPGFPEAAEVWLVETSAPLRSRQAARLGDRHRWAGSLDDIPRNEPVILVANEFLDCIPIRQAERRGVSWRERVIDLDGRGGLRFEVGSCVAGPRCETKPGVWEFSPALSACGREVAALLLGATGAALFIDYGRGAAGTGDTLQAIRNHSREGPLENPGAADLTAWVDFPAFLAAAGSPNVPILSQSQFLRRLGIEARAASLATANPHQAGKILRQLERLIGVDKMGELFKVVALSSPGLVPPAFEAP